MKQKDINYSAPKDVEAKTEKLLSPQEWADLKIKIEWGTANYQERNKYNMIVKHLNKNK